MVPILSARLVGRKDLLYNGRKLPEHPVATLRLPNDTGLTLERGPVTVLDQGEYVGEAVLAFTVAGEELVVPYAVELGVKVQEESGSARRTHGLEIKGAYVHFEEWDVRWREYRLHNSTGEAMTVLVEHPRTAKYDLFETPEPQERTPEFLRIAVEAQARDETRLTVRERRLVRRREELKRQSYSGLAQYLRQGLIDQEAHRRATELLKLWEAVGDQEKVLKDLEGEREKIYKAQKQIQGNMGALDKTGKEGSLRARYVQELEQSEDQLRSLAARERQAQAEIERLEERIAAKLRALS
jgi:hypothetical protein